MTPNKFLKMLNSIKIGSLWAYKNLWGYGRKVHANIWPWGTPGSRFMTIFGSYAGSNLPNIGYFDVYTGIRGYLKVYKGI